jgi:hypothetical protein
VDKQLGNVCSRLDGENPAVVAPDPATNGLNVRNVEVRHPVILIENFVPALVELDASATENRAEEIELKDVCTDTPKVKETVTPRFDV